MTLVGFKAQNHRQQVGKRGANPKVDDRATTPEVFSPLHKRFNFTIDAAASAENTKCPRFYSIDDDGLAQSWWQERVWCNPPYSNIEPWIEKAWSEWRDSAGPELIAMLLPANRTEQGWWQRQVEPHLRERRADFHVEFMPGRLRFLAPGALEIKPNERPPFGCCLLIWSNQAA
jgi:phage N-6-adenine-methyltransferase